MPQTVEDIIARVAYEVNDELFKVIKKPEMIRALDRVYRQYCQITLIKTGSIAFKGDGVLNEFDLFGPVDTGGIFGDNFFRLYRVEYQGRRIWEQDFESVMNMRHHHHAVHVDSSDHRHHKIIYAIRYIEKYQRMYFSFILPLDSVVTLWYYEYPRLGTINALNQLFPIDDKNTDDLIIGLSIWAWKKMKFHYIKEMQEDAGNEQGQKDGSMVGFCSSEMAQAIADWKEILLQRSREFSAYREEVTPIVLETGSPFSQDIDVNTEMDFDGFEI